MRLTEEQITRLKDIKESGGYRRQRDKRYNGYRREVLWQVLYETLKIYGKTSFRAKELRKDYRLTNYNRFPLMADCPLTLGEVINAIKYGYDNGLIVKAFETRCHSRVRWVLVAPLEESCIA